MGAMTRAEMLAIHREFRAKDESHLWPISGRFNATERAIRNLREYRATGYSAEEYRGTLEGEISRIVNDPYGENARYIRTQVRRLQRDRNYILPDVKGPPQFPFRQLCLPGF